jgi:hypothetical protein
MTRYLPKASKESSEGNKSGFAISLERCIGTRLEQVSPISICRIMGEFCISKTWKVIGWTANAGMGATTVGFIVATPSG